MDYIYRFPAVEGVQAYRKYYIAMVPLKMLVKLFAADDEFVLPEYRAQRRLNESRIPIITKYITDNRDNYVFSALAASIDGEYQFIENNDVKGTGVLEVSIDSNFLINDGQHRKAAIVEAIKKDKSLENETISVVFFEDMGLSRSQQMFTDLNKHAVKTSNSISELYDSRDELAVLTRNVISEVPFFDEYVDKEKDILGKFSSALFTLNTIYTANKRIIGREIITDETTAFLIEFWQSISKHMIPWNDLQKKEINKTELREKYIACQAVVIQALARVGAQIFNEGLEIDKYISRIESINWKRNCTDWKYRVIHTNGRMMNNEKAILLASVSIKKKIGLVISKEEEAQEKEFLESVR